MTKKVFKPIYICRIFSFLEEQASIFWYLSVEVEFLCRVMLDITTHLKLIWKSWLL